MNYKYIFLSALFFCGVATEDPRSAKILDYQLERTPTGHYFFRFESSDGTVREEEGNVLDPNAEDSPIIVKGSYSYTDLTGKIYTVRYTADENGFHPEGDHISVPSYVVNPNPVASTPRPLTPVHFIQTSPRPQFVPSAPTHFQINPFSSTARPEISRVQIPLDSGNRVTSKPIPFNELDGKLQNSIVNLLSNGDGRGFTVGAVNSI